MQAFRNPRGAMLLAAALAGCASGLAAPGESTRMTGSITSDDAAPVHILVTEPCSTRLYLFEKCPGNFVGDTKLGKPGKFLIEVDTESPELVLFAYQGSPGSEKVCSVTLIDTQEAAKPLDLKLEAGNCQEKFQELNSSKISS